MEKISLDPKIENFIKNIKSKKKLSKAEELSVKSIKNKVKNSKELSNVKVVRDDGLLELKTGDLACVLEVNAVDLSLSGKYEKEGFFYYFKDIFKIKNYYRLNKSL